MTAPEPRTYRFGPLDRGDWILGLGGTQCLAIAAGIVASAVTLDLGAPAPAVIAPAAAGVLFALATWDGRPVHEWVPLLARHALMRVTGRHGWMAPLPLLGARAARPVEASLPPFLEGLRIVPVDPERPDGMGVVVDEHDGTVSASLPVRSREFSLVERSEQERAVQLWGAALAGFCVERSPVSRVRVTEWAAPAGLAEHEQFLARTTTQPAEPEQQTESAAVTSYRELLAAAGPLAVDHEVLVTVTVDPRRLRADGPGRRQPRRDRDRDRVSQQAIGALVDELRLLAGRLDAAGLHVDAPLSANRIAETMRLRFDPTVAQRLTTRRATLAELAGVVSSWNRGPLATESAWPHLRVDGAVHRTYWVAEWPRLDVPPNWLEPVLLHAGGTRTFAVHYEPVPATSSRRRIDRDSTRLAADEEQRARAGFRVGARHRRAQRAVVEREAELVSGYAELEYAGFVTVTAADEAALARACAEYEQVAAQAGLELRALDGRHDLGFVCSLPVGRGLSARRFA